MMCTVDASFLCRLQGTSAVKVPTTRDQWTLLIRNVWDAAGELADGRFTGGLDIADTLDALEQSLKTS